MSRNEMKQPQMIADQEWYEQAGRNPLREEGFTPELMRRIELAEANGTMMRKRWFSGTIGRSLALGGCLAAVLAALVIWPLDGGGMGQTGRNSGAASVQPSAAATAAPGNTANDYNPPPGSAEFEIDGQKYYMPLPSDREQSRATAVKTSAGIVWSSPPPVADYLKPGYTHPTEPYSLYLSPAGQPELSANTAQRVYTYPLYAGSAQTFNVLGYLGGAKDYLLIVNVTYTIGEKATYGDVVFSVMNIADFATGKNVKPEPLVALDSHWQKELWTYRSLIGLDKEHEEMVFVTYTKEPGRAYTPKVTLFELGTGVSREIDSIVQVEVQGTHGTAVFEVDGKKRSADVEMLTGEEWTKEGSS